MRDERWTGGRFKGEYMALGMCFGLLFGLLLLGGFWFLGIPLGMMVGSLIDWRRSKARPR